jgi:general secretion pathway protein L
MGGRRMTMIPPDQAILLLFAEDDVGAIEGWFRLSGGRIVARGGGLAGIAGVADDERVMLVLRGPVVAIGWLQLTTLTEPQAIAAARLALAERSVAGVDHLHVAIGDVHGGRRMAATVDADLLGRWIAWAQGEGLDPDHIIPLPLLIAYGDGPVRLWERHGLGNVRGHDLALAIETDMIPIVLDGVETLSMDDARFEAELPVALETLPLDLRQGRFGRRRQWRVEAAWWHRMRRYAIAALIMLALVPVARFGRIAYDEHHFTLESRRVARLALGRESLPDDPRVALQQKLTGLRGPGLGFSMSASILFGAVAQTPNVELSGLAFDQSGTMTANVSSSKPADLADLVRRIGQSGLTVEAMPGAVRGSSVLQVHP